MQKIFGTDGVRGKANCEPMTPNCILRLAQAISYYYHTQKNCRHVVIGKDTRLSGYMLEPALTAGFVSMGVNVTLLGPLPTPAVSMLTRSLRADLGVMISASHNSFEDNGVKFFDVQGFKLSDQAENEIEDIYHSISAEKLPCPSTVGRARRLEDALGRYIEFVKQTFPKDLPLTGVRIVVDSANGAAYKTAPTVLWELGAEIISIADQPDGKNINLNCGTTYPQRVQQEVLRNRADLGICLDGDADRVLIIDEKGQVIDGDQIMGLIACRWKKANKLAHSCVVGTVMSNQGLVNFLQNQGIEFMRTRVGDRYVAEKMRELKANLGGEQSGHIIMGDYTSTGDGIIAALQVLAAIVQSKKPASEVCRVFDPMPQVLKNVVVTDLAVLDHSAVKEAIQSAENALRPHGRVLVRKSGTESLIRIMAEGPDAEQLNTVIQQVSRIMTDSENKFLSAMSG